MQPRSTQAGVVRLNHALRVALAYGRGVRVHGIQKELNRGGVAAQQLFGVVIWNYNSGIHRAAADCVAELIDGRVVADQLKTLALAQCGHQFPALRRSAVIHGSQFDVGHGGDQSEAKQHQLQCGRKNERESQPAVAPDLAEFFADQRAHSMIEDLRHSLCLKLHAAHRAPSDGVKDYASYSDDYDFEPGGRPTSAFQQRVAYDLNVIPAPYEIRDPTNSSGNVVDGKDEA